MNSQSLKQKFPEIYQEFFSQAEKVASAPHSFFWTGDFSGFYGGLTILQKIPLRFYIGLSKIAPKKIEVQRTFPAYFSSLKKFGEISLDDHLYKALCEVLKEKFKGYKVFFLSEVRLGSSLGGLGALSACLARLINPSSDLLSNFNIASEILRRLQMGRTSSATAYTALSTSSYPVVFYSKGVKYWAKSLDKLYSLPEIPIWPIDFGLIFSGNLVLGKAVIASAEEIKKTLKKRENEIKKLIRPAFSNSFWDTYLSMLNQVASQTTLALVDLFKKGADDSSIEFFFDTLNQYQNLLHFLNISTQNIDQIYSAIHQMANKIENQVGSGCKMTGVGKGGEVLFALPFGQYREKIESLITALKPKIPNISLDYTSWSDGLESEGVKIEQDLNEGILSNFIKTGSFILKVFYKDDYYSIILDEKDLEKEKKKINLWLDTIDKKIYLKGRGVDSRTLSSQRATIEILTRLLKKADKKLKNTELPKTYAENRYDLQGKITIPLSRLVPLKFEIQGGIYENYTLKLLPFDIKVGVLEKII